jgi:hypothetical protein
VNTIYTRLANARIIRAPRGSQLSAKSWLTEAPCNSPRIRVKSLLGAPLRTRASTIACSTIASAEPRVSVVFLSLAATAVYLDRQRSLCAICALCPLWLRCSCCNIVFVILSPLASFCAKCRKRLYILTGKTGDSSPGRSHFQGLLFVICSKQVGADLQEKFHGCRRRFRAPIKVRTRAPTEKHARARGRTPNRCYRFPETSRSLPSVVRDARTAVKPAQTA